MSEIVGSIQKRKLEMIQPNQYSMQLDESATKAFADALQHALADPAKHKLENASLHLTVEVELENNANLYWYYQPRPDVIAPKRMLNQNGLAKQAFIGLKDDELL
ncbi:hypothetical protein [Vibrio cionasavignyae]|uniref:hypothetical protein n=1 Tax=Vibrio cionasavignyae TaxID=2910252 RepID=UPI003D11529D